MRFGEKCSWLLERSAVESRPTCPLGPTARLARRVLSVGWVSSNTDYSKS